MNVSDIRSIRVCELRRRVDAKLKVCVGLVDPKKNLETKILFCSKVECCPNSEILLFFSNSKKVLFCYINLKACLLLV